MYSSYNRYLNDKQKLDDACTTSTSKIDRPLSLGALKFLWDRLI